MEHSGRKRSLTESPSVDTLDARIDSLEGQFHELDTKFTTGFAEVHRRMDLNAAETSKGMQAILSTIDNKFSRAAEAADRSRPSIGNVLLVVTAVASVAVAVLGGFGKAELDPITERLAEHTAQVERLRETTETRDELAARFANVDTRSGENKERITLLEGRKAEGSVVDANLRRLEADVARLQAEADETRDKQVPRDEMDYHWKDEDSRLTNMNSRLESIGREINEGVREQASGGKAGQR